MPRADDKQNHPRDASWHPSFANHHAHEEYRLPRMIPKSGVRFSDKIMRTKKGGGAPIGAPSMSASHDRMLSSDRYAAAARSRAARLSALRRGTRQNASAVGSAPVPAFPETRLDGCYPLSPVSSLPSSSETGRHAGRAVAQSRPRAVCETARGHRTRSASRSHQECALR